MVIGRVSLRSKSKANPYSEGGSPVELSDIIKSSAPYLLMKAARLQAALYRGRTAHSDVTPAATYILYELTRQEPLTPKDLSERLSLGPAAIGQTLTRMERNGLITRERSETNKRWVQVRLTQKGRSVVPALNEQAMALLSEMTQVLGDEEEQRFERDLQKLISYYEKMAEREGSLTYANATNATGTEI